MRLLLTFFRAYPWRTSLALVAIIFAGIADGLSISSLLPLLNLVTRGNSNDGTLALDPSMAGSGVEAAILNFMAIIGLKATLGILLILVVLTVFIKSMLTLLANYHVGYSAAYIITDLRLALLRAVLTTRWEYFLHQPAGKLANAMATEAYRASEAYVFGVTMLAMIFQAIVYMAIAFSVSWKTTMSALAIVAVILSISHLLVRMARRAGKLQTKLNKSLLTRLIDTLQSVKSLKAMAREDQVDSVLSGETSKLNRAMQHEIFSRELLDAVQNPLFTTVIAIGIYYALQYLGMSFAEVMVLVILLLRALSQLGKIQKQHQKMASRESAFWSIRRAINRAEQAREVSTGTTEPRLESDIRFENVTFAYGDKPILRDLTITIPARTLTTIIGPSGAGKTTLVDLVIGLYQPLSGTIYIDNKPLNQIDMKKWRRKIGYVPQEQLLLNDSILTNVTFGDPALTESDAEYALKAAGAWDFVSAIPEGIHANVGERGARLSGGQRQRIMIARALAHRPIMLILDEPTSALDPHSEAVISETLRALRKDYTILAISHQPALAETADVTYRLQDGQIFQPARED